MKRIIQYYAEGIKELIAIDCIIFGFDQNELKLLCFKRIVEPEAGGWSLLGSFIQHDESLDQAAKRILFKLTGLDNVYMRQLYAHGEVDRDPGARVISISYFALINIQDRDHQLIEDYGAKWFSISNLPKLVLDHQSMVDYALKILKKEAKYKPIGFELLPEKFTLPRLQSLYEAMYQKNIDNRNFRKSILKAGILEKLEEKERHSSKRGAYFYRFNKETYQELTENGYYLDIVV